jgi:hypothetical protein
MRGPLTASVALVAFALSSQVDAVTIVNGGFEAQSASIADGHYIYTLPTGWNEATYLFSATFFDAIPPQGRIFAAVGNCADCSPGTYLSQTITGLVSGDRYDVTFDLGANDFYVAGGMGQVEVSMLSGSSSASQIYSAPHPSGAPGFQWTNWSHPALRYEFTASGTSAEIAFQQTAATHLVGDIGIDNVSIAAAVPEPETYALLLGGLAVLGWAARRRSRLSA